VGALFRHAVGEFLNGDSFGHDNVAHLLLARLGLSGEMRPPFLFARTLQRRERTRTRAFILVQRAIDGQLAALPAIVDRTVASATGLALFFLLALGPLDRLGTRHRRELARAGGCF